MQVLFSGINSTHNKGIKINQPKGFGSYLFLRLKTPARFYLDGKSQDAAAGDIILFKKGSPQYYESICNPPYIDDYMFFDTDTDEDQLFMDSLCLKYDQILHLPNEQPFMSIHQMICAEIINQDEHQAESIHCLLKCFLIKLNKSMNTDCSSCDHALFERFHELRLTLYHFPGRKWTIKEMAAFVNLSPSYFQNIYRNLFHISCMADLFTSRMSHAKTLLATTQLPIFEIAQRCGYESNIYFSRHFKNKVGTTPSEYRKLMLKNNV